MSTVAVAVVVVVVWVSHLFRRTSNPYSFSSFHLLLMVDGSNEKATPILQSYKAFYSNFVFAFFLQTFENLEKIDIACILAELPKHTTPRVFI